jgi:Holliday junction resolvase RusA-like endonuclease
MNQNEARDGGQRFIIYEVFVSGIPEPQPRPRLSKQGPTCTPHTADAGKAGVKAGFTSRLKPTIGIPVYLTARFYLPRSKRVKPDECMPPTGKPDLDNRLKSAADALTDRGVWKDGPLAVQTAADKQYAE